MLFRMEANGVTPIPAPTRTATSYLKTSSDALPNGPSMKTRGNTFLIEGSTSSIGELLSMLTTADFPAFCLLPRSSKLHPTALASALVKFPTQRICTEM